MSSLILAGVLVVTAPPMTGPSAQAKSDSASRSDSSREATIAARPRDVTIASARVLRDMIQKLLERERRVRGDHSDRLGYELVGAYQDLQADLSLRPYERRRLTNAVRSRLTQIAKRRQYEQSVDLEADSAVNSGAQFAERVERGSIMVGGRRGQALSPTIAEPNQAEHTLLKSLEAIEPDGWEGQGGPGRAVLFQQFGAGGIAPRANQPGGGPAGQIRNPGPPNQGVADNGDDLVELIQRVIAPESWDVNGGPGTIVYFQPRQALVVRQTSEVHENLANVVRQLRRAGN